MGAKHNFFINHLKQNDMETKKIDIEEFVELFSDDVYTEFRETLKNTELCDGSFKGSYKDDDSEHPYLCTYWIWYDIKNGLLTWQFDLTLVNETDKALASLIEQWLVDVVNDDLALSLEINA